MHTLDKNTPLVSILMGVRYQRGDISFLERAIHSIQAQTYSNWEFLICERDSTAEARVRLERFVQEDARIHLVDGRGTASLSERLNRCIREAQGEWLARMDDDDFSHPKRITVQMEYLQENPQAAFVGCIAQLERDGQPVGIRQLPQAPIVRDFLFVQPFLHPTLLFRRKALEQMGGYCEEPRCLGCEDYDLLLRLYEAGLRGENIQEPLFTYTLPPLGNKKRTMALRWNEAKTRYIRFIALRLLPKALPYVVKPMAVGLVPEAVLIRVKQKIGLEG